MRKFDSKPQVDASQAEARAAYSDFLSEIARAHYAPLRHAVNQLAAADCLLSLAQVAMRDGYVRPEFVDEDALDIVAGRHPMVEALRDDPFVPNDVGMGRGSPRSKIITGPNMGGKSSCVRMVALIAIMAQIGCYVPAEAVRMSLLDSVLTRMGGEYLLRLLERFGLRSVQLRMIWRADGRRSWWR